MKKLPTVGQLSIEQQGLIEDVISLDVNDKQKATLFNMYLDVDYSVEDVNAYIAKYKGIKTEVEDEEVEIEINERSSRNYHSWDKKQEAFIIQLHNADFSSPEIANAFEAKFDIEITPGSIRNKIRHLKIAAEKTPAAPSKAAATPRKATSKSKKIAAEKTPAAPSKAAATPRKATSKSKKIAAEKDKKADVVLSNTNIEEDHFLIDLRSNGYTCAEIAKKFTEVFGTKITAKEVRNRIRAVILKRRRDNGLEEEFEEVLGDQDLQSADGRQRVLEYVATAGENLRDLETRQTTASVEIPDDKEWQLIVFAGDWHIGSQVVDMRRLIRETKLVAETSNCWYVFVGDATDNFTSGIKITGGQHEQAVPPKVARIAVGALFDILSEKLLAVTTGCHDLWSINIDDYNLVEELAQKHNCAYLGYGGKVELQAGKASYKMTALHKFRMNSSLNIDHACRRYLQMEDMDNDIVAIAHNHVPFIGYEYMQDRPRVLIRTSAYKGLDRFCEKLMITDGNSRKTAEDKVFTPCVLVNTKRHGLRVAHSIPEGIGLLHFLNSLSPEDYQAIYGDMEAVYSEAAG